MVVIAFSACPKPCPKRLSRGAVQSLLIILLRTIIKFAKQSSRGRCRVVRFPRFFQFDFGGVDVRIDDRVPGLFELRGASGTAGTQRSGATSALACCGSARRWYSAPRPMRCVRSPGCMRHQGCWLAPSSGSTHGLCRTTSVLWRSPRVSSVSTRVRCAFGPYSHVSARRLVHLDAIRINLLPSVPAGSPIVVAVVCSTINSIPVDLFADQSSGGEPRSVLRVRWQFISAIAFSGEAEGVGVSATRAAFPSGLIQFVCLSNTAMRAESLEIDRCVALSISAEPCQCTG